MFIRSKIVSVAFIALILPYTIPSIIESRAEAQVSKQSRSDADQQAIIQAYRIMAIGFKNKDVSQIFYFHAPEFIHIEDGQVANLVQSRQGMQRSFESINQVVSSNYNFKQIQVNSSTATVLGTGHISTIAVGAVRLSIVFQFQDTWKRTTSGEWKAISTRILQRDIDLKPGNQPPPLPDNTTGGSTSPAPPR